MSYTNGLDDPSAHFQCELYTGNSGTNAITFSGNSNMQPDMVWNKRRDVGFQHALWNSTNGVGKYLVPNSANAEATFNYLTSFDSDGLTFGNADQSVNVSGGSYVLWNWKCGGGTTSSNTDGTITSTVQANTTAGFSIVSYTGNSTAGATIGHGLGAVPQMIIVKRTNSNNRDWAIYHKDVGNTHFLQLNELDAAIDSVAYWNDTTPTSSVFTVGTGNNSRVNAGTLLAFCFAEKQGYSKFGKYTGNGSSNGAFVYTGFAPAFVMIKDTSQSTNWEMYDIKRNPHNVRNLKLGANLVTHENGSDLGNTSQNNIDILSNGFKMRTGNTDTNVSGDTYIYMAFAENPLVTSDTGGSIPATAR